LEGSMLTSAILIQADFTDADLTLADLTNSNMQYAKFDGIISTDCEGCP
ncbi:MAG: pentapeptide repeat-containing protein, partial [Nitrosopumilaceae archaeon]|nr:pentapeptide repeat-containing protein [Nitrosopumilaceae archaeon]